MTPLQALVLGIVQGLTEFIPVSSSAHLVLIPWLLGWSFDTGPEFVFHILVQLGTLLAVIVYFRTDLWALARGALEALARRQPFGTPEARTAWLLAVASIPAGLIGITLKDYFESTFGDPVQVAVELLGTSALIWISELVGKRNRPFDSIRWPDALVMGFGQALAILPGISRSAASIGFGLGRNLDRPSAARFSFLMSVPIFIGAGAVALVDLIALPGTLKQVPPLLVGFAASAVVGYVCIHWLLRFLARRPMMVFAYYCTAASLLFLGLAALRG